VGHSYIDIEDYDITRYVDNTLAIKVRVTKSEDRARVCSGEPLGWVEREKREAWSTGRRGEAGTGGGGG
jgi:hypothetical protein